MDICLLWVLCVVRWRSLRWADHSSRWVLLPVVRRCVWSEISWMRRSWPTGGCRAKRNKQTVILNTLIVVLEILEYSCNPEEQTKWDKAACTVKRIDTAGVHIYSSFIVTHHWTMNFDRPFMILIKLYECVEKFTVVIPCLYCMFYRLISLLKAECVLCNL